MVVSPIQKRNMFLFFLMMMAVGLSLSKPLITLGEICIGVLWLFDGNIKTNILNFFKNKIAIILSSVYLLTVLGLLHTSNFDFAFDDLRRKLPLLLLPFLFSGFEPLNKKEFELLFKVFVVGVVASSLWSIFVMLGGLEEIPVDKRDLSRFTSHIRFGLMVAFSIIGAAYYFFNERLLKQKIVWAITSLWLFVFLFVLHLITGIVVFFITITLLLFLLGIKHRKMGVKIITLGITLVIAALSFGYVYNCYHDFYVANNIEPMPMYEYSPRGEKLFHDTISSNSEREENGNYVYRNVARKELENSWNKRSKIKLDSIDLKGQHIRFTLMRFITSKGLLKTADAVEQLTEEEIKAIERGVANYKYLDMNMIELRLHKIFWEIEMFKKYNVADGHSVMLRWLYWKTGFEIIKEHPIIGVGTGDVQDVFNEKHQADGIVSEKYWRRAHNQYLTYFITYGVIGGIYFLFFLFYPIVKQNRTNDLMYVSFFSIVLLSMLTEDTLETQVGITFFAFFNTLLILKKQA